MAIASVRVAAIQLALGSDPAANLAKCGRYVDEACRQGARLVLLPELCNHPSRYASQQQAYTVATTMPGPWSEALGAVARRHQAHVAFNVTVRGPAPTVYDTTVLLGPGGESIGTYETECISVGRAPGRVYATDVGRIGLYICMDGLVPETTRSLALGGAQILLNSLASGGPDEEWLHIPVRAAENRVWVISANRVGPIAGGHVAQYAGGSQIVDPRGLALACASITAEQIVYATVNPDLADDKRVGEADDLLADRRPDLYGLLLAPTGRLPRAAGEADARLPRVRVSAVQVSYVESSEQTAEQALRQIQTVADEGSRLVVLPELFPFAAERIAAEPDQAARVSVRILDRLQRVARERRIWLVASLVEAADDRYYSTAYLLDDLGGPVARYRQVHLGASERRWATPGEALDVYETPWGRLGMMVGYDGLFPETARVLALQGADLVAYPGTWRLEWEPRLGVVERAAENRVCLIAAARADSPIARGSLILAPEAYPTDPHWWARCPVPVEIAAGNGSHLSAALHPGYGREKRVFARTDLIHDRRPDLYGALAAEGVLST